MMTHSSEVIASCSGRGTNLGQVVVSILERVKTPLTVPVTSQQPEHWKVPRIASSICFNALSVTHPGSIVLYLIEMMS